MTQQKKKTIDIILPVGFELVVWQPTVGAPWEVALHRYGCDTIVELATGSYLMSKSMKVYSQAGNHRDNDGAITQCDIPTEIRETLGQHFNTSDEALVVKNQLVQKYGRYFRIQTLPETLDVSKLQQYTQTAWYV